MKYDIFLKKCIFYYKINIFISKLSNHPEKLIKTVNLEGQIKRCVTQNTSNLFPFPQK